MRIWYGIDREYSPSYGLMTLFVESKCPKIDKIMDILSNLDVSIECVYFGAGEVDIIDWEFIDNLYKVSDTFKVKVIVESSKQLPQYVVGYFDVVILRMFVSRISNNVYIKYRSDISVGIAKASDFKCNPLFDLQNGQYSCDTEIYNDEEECL